MSATFFRFKVGKLGASMAHMEYISRQTAVLDQEEGVLMRNIPDSVKEARNYRELRENLACYAWVREKSERAIYRAKAKGGVRTHYRVMASFERDVSTEKIKQMMNEWLESKVPSARACGFIHRDTDHTHIHIWVDARQINGEKLHFGSGSYKSLDKEWNRVYSKEMGRPEKEYLDRIERNKQERVLKNEMNKLLVLDENRDGEVAKKQSREIYVQREEHNTGVKEIDQERARGNQQQTSNVIERGQERESTIKAESRESRGGEQRGSRGERVLPRASGMAGERVEEAGRQDIGSREREAAMAPRKQIVGETNRELEEAIQSTKRTIGDFKDLEREYEQTIERLIEQEQEREEAEAYEYERDYSYEDRDDYDEPGR